MPDPPLGKVLAGRDVIAVARAAARLLGKDPDRIGHLLLADTLREKTWKSRLPYNDPPAAGG